MTAAPAWQQGLARNLSQRPVLIVHGNIRDRYVDATDDYPHLRSLLTSRLQGCARSAQLPSSVRIYDWVRGQRLWAHEGSDPPKVGNGPAGGIEGLAVDLQMISDWLVGGEGDGPVAMAKTAIIDYSDLLVPYQQSYDDNQRLLLIRLEKLLGNVQLPHHVVLLALEDSWLPPHLYTQAPAVATLRIPLPEERERKLFLQRWLQGSSLASWQPTSELQDAVVRMTSGLYLREFADVAGKMGAESVGGEEHAREVLIEWRTGRRVSPWAEIETKRLQNVDKVLSGQMPDAHGGVVGQEEAIRRVSESLVIARAGLTGLATSHEQKPKMVFVFAGPTGVGKTELARQIAEFVFGDKDAIIRFDMSEYKGEFTVSRLLGAPPGYVGHEQGGQLTTQVNERPFSILLFDEIEKGDERILDVFLQILDDGRLTDSRGQTVFFGETAVIFTTNVGARNIEHERPVFDRIMRELSGEPEACKREVRRHFQRCVERFFSDEIGRPELFNRLRGNVVPFNPIVEDDVRIKIASQSLAVMEAQFAERNRERQLSLSIDRALAPFLLTGWAACVNAICDRRVLLDADAAVEVDNGDLTCPACGSAVELPQAPASGDEGGSGRAGFGGRGVADDIEAALSFELALALLEREHLPGPGTLMVGLGARGTGGTAVVDVVWQDGP
ncbi:MAG: AAA family ATPase [Actinomycetota bacterium]|nr:AAA family ATPase [Actinomycetota bacterium]